MEPVVVSLCACGGPFSSSCFLIFMLLFKEIQFRILAQADSFCSCKLQQLSAFYQILDQTEESISQTQTVQCLNKISPKFLWFDGTFLLGKISFLKAGNS